ncbi:unnamed protein product [Sphacelaria rigidula]
MRENPGISLPDAFGKLTQLRAEAEAKAKGDPVPPTSVAQPATSTAASPVAVTPGTGTLAVPAAAPPAGTFAVSAAPAAPATTAAAAVAAGAATPAAIAANAVAPLAAALAGNPTWGPPVAGRVGLPGALGIPGLGLVAPAKNEIPGTTPATPANKLFREMHIGGLPHGVTSQQLQDFMNAAMVYLKLAMGPGNPIIRIAMGMDHNFAFAEFRTQEARFLSQSFWNSFEEKIFIYIHVKNVK